MVEKVIKPRKCSCGQKTHLVQLGEFICYDPKVHGSHEVAGGKCFNCRKVFDDPQAQAEAAKAAKEAEETAKQLAKDAKNGPLVTLKAALKESRIANAELKAHIAELTEHIKTFGDPAAMDEAKKGLEVLQSQLEESQKALEASQTEVAGLKEAVKNSHEEIDKLKAALKKAK